MMISWAIWAPLAMSVVNAIELQIGSADSIREAASTIAYDMMATYTGNHTGDNPGNLPPPYYWWETGAMFMHMVDYNYYTGDPSYNEATIQAMSWQGGMEGEFMPSNQTKDEGNDDQVFWAFATMAAAELKFPPPPEGYPSWTAMSQAVFNLQAERWDPDTCGGGMRWQIQPYAAGFEYKNIASNGGFFQLATRLARYTGNQTYVDWSEKMWNWIESSSLYIPNTPQGTRIADGAGVGTNCSEPNVSGVFSYNYGILIGGLAYIYNHTEDEKWLEPLYGIMNGTFNIFFHDSSKVIEEVGCEPYNDCSTDGLTFKSFTIRWLVLCAQLVPQTADIIWPYIQASAQGAAGQCSGPDNQNCGYHWLTTTWDGSTGVGQQMSALAAVQANMLKVEDLFAPVTLKTGGTSKSDGSAGTSSDGPSDSASPWLTKQITTGDKAGAGILTALVLAFTFGGTYWLVSK